MVFICWRDSDTDAHKNISLISLLVSTVYEKVIAMWACLSVSNWSWFMWSWEHEEGRGTSVHCKLLKSVATSEWPITAPCHWSRQDSMIMQATLGTKFAREHSGLYLCSLTLYRSHFLNSYKLNDLIMQDVSTLSVSNYPSNIKTQSVSIGDMVNLGNLQMMALKSKHKWMKCNHNSYYDYFWFY